MPGARCARSLACKMKKHTSKSTTVTPETPGIPRATGFNGFLRALPGDRAFLSPLLARYVSIVVNVMPASRHQDHTTSPSALAPFVIGANASIASRTQRSWRSRNAPLFRARDARTDARDLPDAATQTPATDWHDGQISSAQAFLDVKARSSFRDAPTGADPESIVPQS